MTQPAPAPDTRGLPALVTTDSLAPGTPASVATAGSPEGSLAASPDTTARTENWILALVTLTVLMVSSSGTILSIAVPVVVRQFEASALASTWLLLAPGLVSTVLLVTFGRLADTFGRRSMFQAGLILFGVSAVLIGFAPSVEVVLALLALQAVADAMLLCNTGAIVASVFTGARLNFAMGIYLAGVSVAQLLGPVLGGFAADVMGWRWIFWIQVPLCVVCVVLGAFLLGKLPPRAPREGRIDLLGAFAILVFLASLLIALSFVQNEGFLHVSVLAGLAVALAVVPVLVWVERRAVDPILPIAMFGNAQFRLANLAGLVAVMPRFTAAILVGLYFQVVMGDSPVDAGLKIIPLAVGVTIGSVVASRCAMALGDRRAAVFSVVPTILALLALLPTLLFELDYATVVAPLLVLGLGIGVFSTLNSAMIIGCAPQSEVGVVNGVRLTVMGIGGSVATAVSLFLATSLLPAHARSSFYEATLGSEHFDNLKLGFVAVFVMMIVTSALSAVFTARITDEDRVPAEVET
ncbi:MFS transporter [Ornithinimicrobium faecis]|uniref:MFS transporter n=1 Tax=Ornithinimicrobium faecis TaxID=2934158 RepID=UPI0021179B56|nr:MFS transporter [Ornithinimicrobium sp. HY1745]